MLEENTRQTDCSIEIAAQRTAPCCPACGGRLIDIRAKPHVRPVSSHLRDLLRRWSRVVILLPPAQSIDPVDS